MTLLITKGGGAVCPQADVYILELVERGEPELRPKFDDPDKTVRRIKLTFAIRDYDVPEADPADVDEAGQPLEPADWNDVEISDFYTLTLGSQSKLLPVVEALAGRKVADDEELDLDGLIGSRMKATVRPKANGYPEIAGPMPARARRGRAPF